MTSTAHLPEIETMIAGLLAEEPAYFLVSLRIKPTNNIKVYLDGDSGLPIEKCVYFNRKLYKLIEERQLYPDGDFSLEVSSPGVDEPLKLQRQYLKNIGRTLDVVLVDETKKTGVLTEVTDLELIVAETTGKGKKAVVQQTAIPVASIKTAIVHTQF